MTNNKKLLEDGPFSGLWIRTARALVRAGYTSRLEVKADLKSGKLRSFHSIYDYGIKAEAEVIMWLVCHGDLTKAEALRRFKYSYTSISMPYVRALMNRRMKIFDERGLGADVE